MVVLLLLVPYTWRSPRGFSLLTGLPLVHPSFLFPSSSHLQLPSPLTSSDLLSVPLFGSSSLLTGSFYSLLLPPCPCQFLKMHCPLSLVQCSSCSFFPPVPGFCLSISFLFWLLHLFFPLWEGIWLMSDVIQKREQVKQVKWQKPHIPSFVWHPIVDLTSPGYW